MRMTILDTDALVGVDSRFSPLQARLFLVGGCCPRRDVAKWLLVARNGTSTLRLSGARLHPFSMVGYRAALLAARALKARIGARGCLAFTARVLVSGKPDAPDEVIEAWRLEGNRRPVGIKRYPFQ